MPRNRAMRGCALAIPEVERMFRRFFMIVTLAALAAGCNGGTAGPPPFNTGVFVPTPTPTPSPTPSPTPAPLHLYVGNDNAGAQIFQYNLPLTAASTPNFTITATNNVVSVAVDANGNLAAGLPNGNIDYFQAPLSGTSVPNLTFSNGGASNNGQGAFLANGNLWAATVSNKVNRFNIPTVGTPAGFVTDAGMVSGIGVAIDPAITGASTPAFALTIGVNTPEGIALDPAVNLYIGNLSDATVTVYNAPVTAASAPSIIYKVSTGAFAIFGIAVGK